MTEFLWKICGAGFVAVSSLITVAAIACLLSGYFQIAAIIFLTGMIGMAAVLVIILWRTAVQQDEMYKH
jgi:hypothetical protein